SRISDPDPRLAGPVRRRHHPPQPAPPSGFRVGPVALPVHLVLPAVLHDQRRLRRRLLALPDGTEFMLDLPAPVTLSDGDRLALSDGRSIAIVAAHEPVYEVKGR